jgi:hypothetical protein
VASRGKRTSRACKAPAHVVNAKLWCRIKERLRAKTTRWNAYTSGQLVQQYKREGGKFRGKKGSKPLAKWYAEKWVDLARPLKGGGYAACGRSKRDGGYPLCRPARIAAKIPKAKARKWVAQKRAAGGSKATVRFPKKYAIRRNPGATYTVYGVLYFSPFGLGYTPLFLVCT